MNINKVKTTNQYPLIHPSIQIPGYKVLDYNILEHFRLLYKSPKYKIVWLSQGTRSTAIWDTES